MRTIFLITMIVLFTASFGNASEIQLGKPITLQEVTKVSEINKNPEKYIDQEVLIEGLVIDVCSKRGCWMDVASDLPFEKIQVKVVDGVIVFPMEAKGKNARVQGTVEALRLSKEQAISLQKHYAEEKGGSFDPSTVTGPQTYYRIRGLGAVIE